MTYSVVSPVPAPGDIVDGKGKPTTTFITWLQSIFSIVSGLTQSGTTAQRPTTQLFVGRFFFDTTLGYPVWVLSVNASTYVATWVNGAGTKV